MVDSCFRTFKFKCFRKSTVNSLRDSRESIFQSDKNEKISHDDKKLNFTTCSTPIATDNELELEHGVVLRRHNRTYLHSISTTTSYDAMSSGDEADEVAETLDVLYPLPRVKTHERPLAEEANSRPSVDDKNGKMDLFISPAMPSRFIDNIDAPTQQSFSVSQQTKSVRGFVMTQRITKAMLPGKPDTRESFFLRKYKQNEQRKRKMLEIFDAFVPSKTLPRTSLSQGSIFRGQTLFSIATKTSFIVQDVISKPSAFLGAVRK